MIDDFPTEDHTRAEEQGPGYFEKVFLLKSGAAETVGHGKQ
jgi:hypothetical protein